MSHPRRRFPGLVVTALALAVANPGAARAQEIQAVPGPSDLKAEAVSPSRIDLTWNRVTTSLVVEYRLYYADGTLIVRLPPWQTRYSDTDLEPWTQYRGELRRKPERAEQHRVGPHIGRHSTIRARQFRGNGHRSAADRVDVDGGCGS